MTPVELDTASRYTPNRYSTERHDFFEQYDTTCRTIFGFSVILGSVSILSSPDLRHKFTKGNVPMDTSRNKKSGTGNRRDHEDNNIACIERMKHTNYRLQCRDRELDLTGQAKIMGILNSTPDSFFDGGSLSTGSRTIDVDRAVEKGLKMIEEGADIIDIGGESTKPGALKVDAEEELRRILPVIRELRRQSDILISVDTYKATVAEQALLAGAQLINDISGFSFDPDIAQVCSHFHAAAILMHTSGDPANMKWSHQTRAAGTDILNRVTHSLLDRIQHAEQQGVCNIIVDPGFGFGKSVFENYTLLRRLHDFHTLKRPLLAGLSRKSFLGKALQKHPDQAVPSPDKRLTATIAANTIALINGANILRVHDIEEAVQTLAVTSSVNGGKPKRPGSPGHSVQSYNFS